MATAAEHLVIIDAAIAAGKFRSVEVDGRRFEFRSLDEMIRWRNTLLTEIGQATSSNVNYFDFTNFR